MDKNLKKTGKVRQDKEKSGVAGAERLEKRRTPGVPGKKPPVPPPYPPGADYGLIKRSNLLQADVTASGKKDMTVHGLEQLEKRAAASGKSHLYRHLMRPGLFTVYSNVPIC